MVYFLILFFCNKIFHLVRALARTSTTTRGRSAC
jgi:hypothetical protein